MSIYTMGDLHLSLSCEKPMDIFKGWDNYVERITENRLRLIKPEDTIVLCGDISWGMSMEEALADFKYIHELPGQKIILKGNHDYWWTTYNKMENMLKENGLDTIHFLHNNSYVVENIAICGSRGWLFEQGQPHDIKILNREANRIKMSLDSVKDESAEKIVFLHYPPVYYNEVSQPIIDVLKEYNIKTCYYGHIHGGAQRFAIDNVFMDIDFHLVSADYLKFCPDKVK